MSVTKFRKGDHVKVLGAGTGIILFINETEFTATLLMEGGPGMAVHFLKDLKYPHEDDPKVDPANVILTDYQSITFARKLIIAGFQPADVTKVLERLTGWDYGKCSEVWRMAVRYEEPPAFIATHPDLIDLGTCAVCDETIGHDDHHRQNSPQKHPFIRKNPEPRSIGS